MATYNLVDVGQITTYKTLWDIPPFPGPVAVVTSVVAAVTNTAE